MAAVGFQWIPLCLIYLLVIHIFCPLSRDFKVVEGDRLTCYSGFECGILLRILFLLDELS